MHTLIDYVLTQGVWVTYLAVFAIIFAESGLLIGFVLPGDSLLLPLGLLAGQGHFNIYAVLALTTVASILGNQVGYLFGEKVGPSLFERKDSRFFKQRYLKKAHEFYEKHGSTAIILGRFVPLARTFAPIIAGIAKMDRRKFFLYNVIGGVAWCFGVTLLGYFLGQVIPDLENYILLIVAAILVVSVVPPAIKVLRASKE